MTMSVTDDLAAIGGVLVPGTPVTGQVFYDLAGLSVRRSVSAFCRVAVIGKSGVPVVGGKVVNLFPDGNGEVLVTDGSGSVQFNFAASSAFSVPGRGPFTVFIADQAVKDELSKQVRWSRVISDQARSLGDWQGEHTEIYLQFVERGPLAPPDALPMLRHPFDAPLRELAWRMRGVTLNPEAALYKFARDMFLGYPLSPEFEFGDEIGTKYVAQLFAGAIVYCLAGDWAHIDVVRWL
jgi:hypothetical protein